MYSPNNGDLPLTIHAVEQPQLSARSQSLAVRPIEGTIKQRRRPLQLHRSQSDNGDPLQKYFSPEGPIDLTAMDPCLLQRTYSNTSIWNKEIHATVPMHQSEGIGRYHRSVHATPEWQADQLKRHMSDLGTLTDKIAKEELRGVDPLAWQAMEQQRSDSFASSKYSSDGQMGGTSDYADNLRPARGFVPSVSSRASSRASSRQGRIDSPPTTSGTSYSKSPTYRIPPTRSALSLKDIRAREDLRTARKATGNIKLVFEGDIDSAIDDSDFEDEPASPPKPIENRSPQRQNVKLSNNKPGLRSNKAVVDLVRAQQQAAHRLRDQAALYRQPTVLKKVTRPGMRRSNSGRSTNGSITSKKKPLPRIHPPMIIPEGIEGESWSTCHSASDGDDDADEEVPLVLDTRNEVPQPHKVSEEMLVDDGDSIASDGTITESVNTITYLPPRSRPSPKSPKKTRRQRSVTAVRGGNGRQDYHQQLPTIPDDAPLPIEPPIGC